MTTLNMASATEEGAITKHEPTSPLSGEWNFKALGTPRVSMLQTQSADATEFGPGSLMYDKTYRLAEGGKESVTVYVRHIDSYYEEEGRTWDPSDPPKKWPTEKEAQEAGFAPKWDKDKSKSKYGHRMTATMIVEVPEEHGLYHHPEGKSYSKVLFTSKNKGASTFGNPVVKAWSNPKAFENPCSIKFELSTELDRSGPKPYWIPKIVNAGKTDDALLKWFNDNID